MHWGPRATDLHADLGESPGECGGGEKYRGAWLWLTLGTVNTAGRYTEEYCCINPATGCKYLGSLALSPGTTQQPQAAQCWDFLGQTTNWTGRPPIITQTGCPIQSHACLWTHPLDIAQPTRGQDPALP